MRSRGMFKGFIFGTIVNSRGWPLEARFNTRLLKKRFSGNP